jgi:hypothetical protein
MKKKDTSDLVFYVFWVYGVFFLANFMQVWGVLCALRFFLADVMQVLDVLGVYGVFSG